MAYQPPFNGPVQVTLGGNTAGAAALISTGTMMLAGGSNVTLSQNGNSVSAYGPTLVNSNAFSFGTNGQSITASYSQSIQTQDIIQAAAINTLGNSAGVTASISSGTMVLAGGNNITLSQNGNNITVSNALSAHATLNSFEPYPNIIGVNSTYLPGNTSTSGPAYFWPFSVPQNVSGGMVELIASYALTANVAGSFSQSIYDQVGIYTRGTGASSSMLSQMTSRQLSIAMSYSNSTMTFSQPTASSTSGYGYAITSSAGLNITSLYSGYKLIQFPIGSSITPGEYWLGFINLNSTLGGNSGFGRSYWGFSNTYSPITALAPFGSNTSAYTSGTGAYVGYANWFIGWGSYTTAGLNALPGTVPIGNITQNLQIMPYFKFVVGT